MEPSLDPKARRQVVREEMVLQGVRFDVHRIELRDDHGNTHYREVVRHPGAVVLLPVLDTDRIVMIRNSRPQVGETLLELPAGTCEPGEPIPETAARELKEETGYNAKTLTKIHEFYSAPGLGDELMHLFAAQELSEGAAARESTEQIENQIVTRDEIRELIRTNQIRDAKTLVGLYVFLLGIPELS